MQMMHDCYTTHKESDIIGLHSDAHGRRRRNRRIMQTTVPASIRTNTAGSLALLLSSILRVPRMNIILYTVYTCICAHFVYPKRIVYIKHLRARHIAQSVLNFDIYNNGKSLYLAFACAHIILYIIIVRI